RQCVCDLNAKVKEQSAERHAGNGDPATADVQSPTGSEPVCQPTAQRHHGHHSKKQHRGIDRALVASEIADLSKVVIDPVKENVLKIVEREIANREEQEVAVGKQLAPFWFSQSLGVHRTR